MSGEVERPSDSAIFSSSGDAADDKKDCQNRLMPQLRRSIGDHCVSRQYDRGSHRQTCDFWIDATAENGIMTPLLAQRLVALETPMHGSVGHIIWTVCYLSVLTGLSAYGDQRYVIIYLYLKNRTRPPP